MSDPFLEDGERTQLIGIVAGLYDFTDQGPRGRRVFLQNAGLARFVLGIDLSGSPNVVAGDVIGRLERYGQLPDRGTYHALGALIAAVLGLGDVDEGSKAFVAGLIVRYGLVSDSDYLSGLRQSYGLSDKPVREPPSKSPARGADKVSAAPGFEPSVDDQSGLEGIINSEDNFIDISLLVGALYCAQAVGRIEAPEGEAIGTGFLVGPDLLLTNQHVLRDVGYLGSAIVRFGYAKDPSGVAANGTVVRFKPDFYYSSESEALDYALARLTKAPLAGVAAEGDLALAPIEELVRQGKHRGYLALAPRALIDKERVNIIQHPDGDPMKVVLTQNYVVHRTDTRLQYVADTMEGSSGSPVFNRTWEVVGLHHSGKPYPPESVADKAKKAWKGNYRVNEGIPMRAILEDFAKKELTKFLPKA